VNQTPLKLFVDRTYVSPYVMSVFVTLVEKGLAFETVPIDLEASQHLTGSYCHESLTARVPMLQQGDFFLSESTAIVEYLDEVFCGPDYRAVLPQRIADRARARQIQAWLRSDLMPIREERPTEVIFVQPNATPLSEVGRLALAKLVRVANRLISSNRPNLFEEWCIADTDLALMLNRLILNGDEVPEQLKRYADFQWQRPSVQQWVQQART
jgi:glutathione S-transferase